VDHHNKENLARIASGLCFLHIWLGIGYLWYQAVSYSFFGEGIIAWLIAGAVLFFFVVNPFLARTIASTIMHPLFRHILDRRIVSNGGCILGLVTCTLCILSALWWVSRDLWTAALVFLLAPLIALIVALIMTLFRR
jgi:multisubunit Na+/H+ antiporter MnhG subunit